MVMEMDKKFKQKFLRIPNHRQNSITNYVGQNLCIIVLF